MRRSRRPKSVFMNSRRGLIVIEFVAATGLAACAAGADGEAGACVGQAWLTANPGETVAAIGEAGFEAVIVSDGPQRWAVVTQPDGFVHDGERRRAADRPGARIHLIDNRVLLAETANGNYLLTSNQPGPDWQALLQRIDFSETGRAACRDFHGL